MLQHVVALKHLRILTPNSLLQLNSSNIFPAQSFFSKWDTFLQSARIHCTVTCAKHGRQIVNVLQETVSSSETSVTFIILPRRNFKEALNILHFTAASGSQTMVASYWIHCTAALFRGDVYVSSRTQQYIGRKSVPLAQKETSRNPELRSACPKDLPTYGIPDLQTTLSSEHLQLWLRDFKLPPRCRWGLRSSGLLRPVCW